MLRGHVFGIGHAGRAQVQCSALAGHGYYSAQARLEAPADFENLRTFRTRRNPRRVFCFPPLRQFG